MSIMEAHGWIARFTLPGKGGTESSHNFEEEIVMWENDESGTHGLIVGSKGRLVNAEYSEGFTGYEEVGYLLPVSASTGWWLVTQAKDNKANAHWHRLIAWGVDRLDCQVMTPPGDDGVAMWEETSETKQIVYDPKREGDWWQDGLWPQDV